MQNAQASSYHSYPQTTSLDKNLRAHPFQSSVANLQLTAVLPVHLPSRTFQHPTAKTLYPTILLFHGT